ncbi:pilin [Acinetobacter sp. YH01009]|uniref:pilin n=1 Tax=Acinetobacter sp. YH01009 TaxID=2601025 RepID=UPI0035A1CD26
MQKGFTLIELMIVVAIIGILAAIAIPQYQNYIAKSQVSRVMSESGSLKTVVEACVNDGRTADFLSNVATGTTVDADECELGAVASTLLDATAGAVQGTTGTAAEAGKNGYPQVAIDATTGVVTIESTFGSGAAASVVGDTTARNTLTWNRSAEGTWTCFTTVESKFRPNGCTASSAP